MTNEQRETIDRLNKDKNRPLVCGDITVVNIADLDTALSLIQRQTKQIDLMARAIDNYDSQLEINTFKDKEHIKQYFAGLVEKE